MKTTWTTLSVVLAAALAVGETQGAGFGRNSRPGNLAGNANVASGYSFNSANLSNSNVKSAAHFVVRQNGPSGAAQLGPVSNMNKFNAVAAKNLAGKANLTYQGSLSGATSSSSGQILARQNGASGLTKLGPVNAANKFNTVAVKNPSGKLSINAAELLRERLQETTTGTKNPWTGQDLSKNANPGAGLPGGIDLSKQFPSAEQRWNDRIKGALGGGSDYLGNGTPFDRKPGSSPLGDFLNEHGGNIPDPLAGAGKSRSGISPAQDAPANDGTIVDSSGGTSVTVGPITWGSTDIMCASDYVSPKDSGLKKDECVAIDYDRDGGFKTEADRKAAVDFWLKWVPKGTNAPRDDGEGGYTGGSGHSVNDLNFGTNARMTGKVIPGRDPGEAGLGNDTGHKMPALIDAIGKYVAQGGKVRGVKGGYEGSDPGLGQDIGGAAANEVSGLKKSIDAQRFVVDPNAKNPEDVPWWMQERVSPTTQASAK